MKLNCYQNTPIIIGYLFYELSSRIIIARVSVGLSVFE